MKVDINGLWNELTGSNVVMTRDQFNKVITLIEQWNEGLKTGPTYLNRRVKEIEIELDYSWTPVEESLPPKKDEWNHSERVVIKYWGGELGIGYYHYNPPYREPGFIDFFNVGLQPTHWLPIPELPVGK